MTFAHLAGLPGQTPLSGLPPRSVGILVELAKEPHCPMPEGEALWAPGQAKGNQAPWMHPLPESADLGQFNFSLCTSVFSQKGDHNLAGR